MSENYRVKIIHAALSACVDAPVGEVDGMVDFPEAVAALIAAIGTLAVQSGNFPQPRHARLFAEQFGKDLNLIMKQIAAQDIGWTLEPIGAAN